LKHCFQDCSRKFIGQTIKSSTDKYERQIRELQIATSQPLGFIVQYTVTIFVAIGLAFYTAWDLTLVTLSTVPVGAFLLAWLSARMQPAIELQVEWLTQASKVAIMAISGIETVKTFNTQQSELQRYRTIVKRAASSYLNQAQSNALQIASVSFLTLCMFVQGFWYGSHLVDSGKKTPGQILTGFWACLMATQAFEQILPQMIVLEKGRTAGAALKVVLIKVEGSRSTVKMAGGNIPRYCEGDIQIQNVRRGCLS
jgi:ATP-binding cassette, subfamily B (MDR/TAP), member 1